MTLENTAKDYSKYCDTNIDLKLKPISKSIDEMLTRLEEFQTMMSFVKQDEMDSKDLFNSFPNFKPDLDEMFAKIDTVEHLITHIKNNLEKLENDMDKAEAELGCYENKVSNIFIPLFRKNIEKKQATVATPNVKLFNTEDYFN